MKNNLLYQFKKMMSEKSWNILKNGYLMGVIAGIFDGINLTLIFPLTISLASGEKVYGLGFWSWIIVLIVCGALDLILDYFGQRTSYNGTLGFMSEIYDKIGDKVSLMPLGSFDAQSAGKYSRLVTQEMINLLSALGSFCYKEFYNKTSIVVVAILLWFFNIKLAVTLCVGVLFYFAVISFSKNLINKGKEITEPYEEEVSSRIVEFARCQPALRAGHRAGNYKALEDALEGADRAGKKGLWIETIGQIIPGIAMQIVIVVSVFVVIIMGLNKEINPLLAIASIGMILRFSKMLENVSGNVSGIEERRQQMKRLNDILNAEELKEVEISKPFTERGAIELERVSFSYDKKNPVLNNISFKVNPNEMVALVGPSGSGKSTIEHLIARFYDVDSGFVKVSGVDVRDLTLKDLMGELSMVFQDVYLFSGSLLENIKMGMPDATEGEIKKACDLAGVTEIANRLPEGFNSSVGEGGKTLSGGESQRVSIARALLKKAPIVLFDEATSALDAENEANIVKSMEELKKTSTILVIAHKLETIRMADKIVVLSKEGCVEEAGTHDELISKDGTYKKFWDYRNEAANWQLY